MGIPHAELGAEPFAIIETLPQGKTKKDLENLVIELFGQEYGLGGVLQLQELGFETWPINESGKIKKPDLQDAVSRHLLN